MYAIRHLVLRYRPSFIFILTIFAAALAQNQPASASDSCRPKNVKTHRINAQAHVFILRRYVRRGGQDFVPGDIIGCAFTNGKWRKLMSAELDPPKPSVTVLNGTYVAMTGEQTPDCGGVDSEFFVRDIESGKTVYQRFEEEDFYGTSRWFNIRDIELLTDGTAAFVIDSRKCSSDGELKRRIATVNPRRARTGEHTIDRGLEIRPRSLTREGRMIRWKKGRAIRHAPFR